MGLEAQGVIQFGKTKATGKAWFEEREIIFRGVESAGRGKFRLAIPLAEVKSAEAKSGRLAVKFSGGTAVLDLGEAAEKWAYKIKNPPSLLDKLGVKPESCVMVIGVQDESFFQQLHTRLAAGSGLRELAPALARTGSTVRKTGEASFAKKGGSELPHSRAPLDLLFYGITAKDELRRLNELRKQLQPAGAIWVVWPKGRKELREDDVRTAAIAAGLVDVKVVSFSETHSALKLVIPRDKR